VEFEPEFSIVSVRKDIAMTGAMTEEEKEEREGLEEAQTPKENGKFKIISKVVPNIYPSYI
jgi:hypothetical protein